MAALSKTAMILALCIAIMTMGLTYLQSTIWWEWYDMWNFPGCKAVIDWWSKEKNSYFLTSQVQSFKDDGFVVISFAIAESKVNNLAREVESMSDTFMTPVLCRFILHQYSIYNQLETQSEKVQDRGHDVKELCLLCRQKESYVFQNHMA